MNPERGNAFPIKIPLINPNEPEALLAAIHVREGQAVAQGALLCTLETTKSAADLEAEAGGYVAGLRFEPGQVVHAGEILCYLAPSPDWVPPLEPLASSPQPASGPAAPDGVRLTQPALALARQLGLDLSALPRGPLLTEARVLELAGDAGASALSTPSIPEAFNPTAILIYGAGGHGKMVLDLLRALGSYRILGFIDDGVPAGKTVLGLPVLGGSDLLARYQDEGVRLAVNAVGGIGNVGVRIQVFERLAAAGFACPALVHPNAWVEPSAILAAGAQVLARAYVGSEARLGYGVIVNTGAIISHDCILDDYAIVSPGAILAGEVQVGRGALIGMGATINLQTRLGAGARVGNSATVKRDLPDHAIVRAGAVWPD